MMSETDKDTKEVVSEVKALSATFILDNSLYKDGVDDFPTCPKCGDKLVPARLTIDQVVTGGSRGITQHYNERQIGEMTVWFCNMSCDAKTLYKADIGPSVSKLTGKVMGDAAPSGGNA